MSNWPTSLKRIIIMEVNNKVKQVLVIREDLKNEQGHKIRTGKVVAQSCHASEAWLFGMMSITPKGVMGSKGRYIGTVRGITEDIKLWIEQGHTKIALKIKGEDELQALYDQAIEAGIIAHIVVDAGLTEFGGVPTKTALAIGPGNAEEIDKITGSLKML